MSFVAKLQRAREVLEQQGRLSVRALGRELALAGDELDELIEELVDVQGVAVREGNVIACAPRSAAAAAPSHPSARTPIQTTPPDPRAYTPKHLADKILTSQVRPRRRTQAGHRAVRRREGLDGAGRARSIPRSGIRSSTASSRSSPRACTASRAR